MSTQVAYSFDREVGSLVRDFSGYLNDLIVSGGVSAQGRWEASGPVGGMDCSAGGGVFDMRTPSGGFSSLQSGLDGTSYGLMAQVKANPGASGEQVLFHVGAAGGTAVDHFTVYASDVGEHVKVRRNGTDITSTAAVLDGGWHHVSVQSGGDLESGGIVVKVDDVEVAHAAASSGSGSSGFPFLAIGQTVGGTLAFDGIIDDVRVLNDPIDSASLSTTNAGFMNAPVVNQLVVQYKFDETTGTTAADTSDNGYDAALTTAAQWSTGGVHDGALKAGDSAAAGSPFGTAAIALKTSDRVTLMCQLKVPSTASDNANETVFEIRNTAGLLRAEFLIAPQSNLAYWRIYQHDGTTQWVPSANLAITRDAWHHYAIALAPTAYAPMLDGVAVGGASSTAPAFDDWATLHLGAGRFKATTPAVLIDDLRVVNNYLYPEAIARHMATGDANPPPPASPLDGAANATSSASGSITVRHGIAGQVDAASAVGGTVTALRPVAGDVAVAFGAAGAITARYQVNGVVDVASGIDGDLTVVAKPELAGLVAAQSHIAGTVTALHHIAGTARATSAVSGAITIAGEQGPTTPPARTRSIQPESRTLAVPAEVRTRTIAREDRTRVVHP